MARLSLFSIRRAAISSPRVRFFSAQSLGALGESKDRETLEALVELIRDGTIGEVRMIQVAFSYDLGDSDQAYANIRRRNDVAGGGIMDVGCYTASMARFIAVAALGLTVPAEPDSLKGVSHVGTRGRVDEWAAAVARFPGGSSSSSDIVVNMICGTRARVQSDVRVWGSGGSMVVPIP